MTPDNSPTQKAMLEYMEEASKIVASWPKWKREVLGNPDYYEKMSVAEQIKTGLEQAIGSAEQANRFAKGDIVVCSELTEENEGRCFVIGPSPNLLHHTRCIILADGKIEDLYNQTLTSVSCCDRDVMQLQAMHIRQVGNLLANISALLARRAVNHDSSKWTSNEWDALSKIAPEYNKVKYNSQRYHEIRENLKPGIEHHEKANSHHLGHYKNGVRDMDLLDLIELLCDWKAASLRDSSSNLEENLTRAAKQHDWSDDLTQVILNTVKRGYFGNS